MPELISRTILDDEVLVRIIFNGHFKRKKTISQENIEDQRIFIDTRSNNVSLLRKRYHDEVDCLKRGQLINTDIAGFVIFKKEFFEVSKKKHIAENNPEFLAELVSSPLDENFETIPLLSDVYSNTPICPGHADLSYINPGNNENEEPNTAIRRFSRVLFKSSKLVLLNDLDFEKEEDLDINFDEIINT